MDKILLIVPDGMLRQLYHEVFVAEHLNVTIADGIANAILMLTTSSFNTIVLYVRDNPEVAIFLKLRQKRRKWNKIRVVLLTYEPDLYTQFLNSFDLIFDPLMLSPAQLAHELTKR